LSELLLILPFYPTVEQNEINHGSQMHNNFEVKTQNKCIIH